jgi:trigger factor
MQFEVLEKSPVLRHIEVTISGNQVGEEEARNYSKLRKTSKIPGFRPGKVPTQVLRQMYGQRVREDVQQSLAQASIRDLLKQYPETLHLSQWSITQPKTEDGGFCFALDLELRPSISIQNDAYKGLKIERPRITVSPDDINRRLSSLQLEHAVFEPIEDRTTVQLGDFISADIQSEVNALCGTDISLEVGSGQPLVDLDQALVGIALNEPRTVSLTLPSNFAISSLANTPAVATVTARAIRKRVLPALDDSFPQEVGSDADSLDALKAEIQQQIAASQKESTNQEVHAQLLKLLRELFPIATPDQYVQTRALQNIENQLNLFQRQGFELSSIQPIVDRMLHDMRPRIAQQVHNEFILDAIADREQVKTGESDLEVFFEKEGAKHNVGAEVVRHFYLQTPGARADLLHSLRRERVLELLLSSAEITEIDPPSPESTSALPPTDSPQP